MSFHKDITGIILAGGKSRRMGRDKALLTVAGEAFLTRIARTMRGVFKEVFIISNDESYRFLSLPVFKDVFPGYGPLAGIHAGLLHSKTPWSFVVACDTPNISKELIEHIIDFECLGDVKISSMDHNVHPLCGLYARTCLPVIEGSLRDRRLRVQDVLARVHTVIVPITSRLPFYRADLLLNVNELQDYLSVDRLTDSLAARNL